MIALYQSILVWCITLKMYNFSTLFPSLQHFMHLFNTSYSFSLYRIHCTTQKGMLHPWTVSVTHFAGRGCRMSSRTWQWWPQHLEVSPSSTSALSARGSGCWPSCSCPPSISFLPPCPPCTPRPPRERTPPGSWRWWSGHCRRLCASAWVQTWTTAPPHCCCRCCSSEAD